MQLSAVESWSEFWRAVKFTLGHLHLQGFHAVNAHSVDLIFSIIRSQQGGMMKDKVGLCQQQHGIDP